MNISINPNYCIRNEKYCSYILYAGNLIHAKAEPGPLVMPIPPYLGMILSSFNGGDYEETIKKCSSIIEIEPDKIKLITEQLINNEEPFISKIGDEKIFIPKNFLIESTRNSKVFTEADFSALDQFKPHRMLMPAYITIMITSKCHTNCIYCYADRSRPDDMQLETILALIEQAHEEGVVNVMVSGGDIFANKDWRIILKKLADYNYHPILSTKVPLKKDDIEFLISIGVEEIQYSVDTLNPESATKHFRINGDKYIEKIREMLQASDELGLPFNVKSVVTKWNGSLKNFQEMFAQFSTFKNLRSWNVVPAFCSSFRDDYETYKPLHDTLVELDEYFKNLKANFVLYTSKLIEKAQKQVKFSTVEEYASKNKTCGANTYTMGVLSNGKVTVCEMLYYNTMFYLGDAGSERLRDIWNSKKAISLFEYKVKVENSDSACYSCKVLEKCKKSMKKRYCLVDVINSYGEKKWDYPDPRCPEGPDCDIEKIM